MERAIINTTAKKVSIKEIETFEADYNVVIPHSYKKLLLKYNGGNNMNQNMLLDILFSLKFGELTIEDSIQYNQILENNIPLGYIPIGYTGTGNEITINVKDENKIGKIYLFRHDELIPILIANSLEELLGVNSIDEL
jgi:cell wall assembly regulator SMI1